MRIQPGGLVVAGKAQRAQIQDLTVQEVADKLKFKSGIAALLVGRPGKGFG